MRGARRRGMGVNNKKGMMKTSWGKPVHVISFIRTLMIVLAVVVCITTLMGCGNKPEEDASPAGRRITDQQTLLWQPQGDA